MQLSWDRFPGTQRFLAFILGVKSPYSLFLAACQLVHVLYYRDLKLGDCMGLDHVRSEIEHMRIQLGRQRKEILQLQRAGISTAAAELLLQRMLAKIDDLCAERDRLKKEEGGPTKGRVLGGRSW
jgi:hypothetical protein